VTGLPQDNTTVNEFLLGIYNTVIFLVCPDLRQGSQTGNVVFGIEK
jgi:hypothetical protein